LYNYGVDKQATASATHCRVNTLVNHRHWAAPATVNKDFSSTGSTTGPAKASVLLRRPTYRVGKKLSIFSRDAYSAVTLVDHDHIGWKS